MKTTLLAVVFASAFVPTLTLAQQPKPRVYPLHPSSPNYNPPHPPPASPRLPANAATSNESLDQNITIRLFSSAPDGDNFDLEVLGSGPTFNLRQVPVSDHLSVSGFYHITKKDASYKIKYQISIRTKIQTNNNTEYIDTSIEGDVLCKDGEAVTILKTGDIPLKLVVNPKPEASGND